jgi:hypothetical protein
MSEKLKVLAALVDLYECGRGFVVIDARDLSCAVGTSVDRVEAAVHQLWSDDYLAYEGRSFRLTEQGYRKYLRETASREARRADIE